MLMASSAPGARQGRRGSQIVYTIKMDAAESMVADFDLSFDNTRLSVVSIVTVAPSTRTCRAAQHPGRGQRQCIIPSAAAALLP